MAETNGKTQIGKHRSSFLKSSRKMDGEDDRSTITSSPLLKRSTSNAPINRQTFDPLKKILNADLDPRDLDHKQLKKAFLDLLELHRQTTHTLSDLKTENLTLDYEVGLLRDEAFERSEELYENERQRKEMQKEIGALERAKREAEELSQRAKSVIEHRDELIKQAGLFLYVDPSKGQEDASRAHTVIPECMLSQSTLQMISEVNGETIEDKMRNLIDQNEQLRKKLCEKVRPMRRLDESPKPPLPQPEEHKPKKNLSARSVGRVESVETKLKIERLETELNNLKEENNWLQIQSRRTKERIEQAEQSEDQALQEKRKLQKELRETKDLLKQATDSNVILQARLDKLRELRRAGGAMSPNKTGLE